MVEVKWTEQAIEDMANIAEFISRDSVKYANLQLDRFFSNAEILEQLRFQEELYRKLGKSSFAR